MGTLVSRKKVSKWQEFNIDDLMQMMGEGDEAKQWYDIVDKLINTEKPVITPNTKVCKLGHCPIFWHLYEMVGLLLSWENLAIIKPIPSYARELC